MPFTLSHAVAALPLRYLLRGVAVFPALVIGCFVPDIPYFLPDPLCDINAHQLPGLVLFGIPCGWAVYALWQCVFLKPGIALLPPRYGLLLSGSAPQRAFGAACWTTTLSLMAGAVSHVAWDAFTHRRGLIVHAWPLLAHPIVHVGRYALPPYFVFQHGGTVLGMFWLAYHMRRSAREIPAHRFAAESTPQLSGKTKIVVVAALPIATAVLVWSTFPNDASAPLRFLAYDVVCRSISCAFAVVAIYAVTWHALQKRTARKSGPP